MYLVDDLPGNHIYPDLDPGSICLCGDEWIPVEHTEETDELAFVELCDGDEPSFSTCRCCLEVWRAERA